MPDIYITSLPSQEETQKEAVKTLQHNGVDVALNNKGEISIDATKYQANTCFVFDESLLQDSFFIRLLKALVNGGIHCALQIGDIIYEYILKPFRHEEDNKADDTIANENNQDKSKVDLKNTTEDDLVIIEKKDYEESKPKTSEVKNENDDFCIIDKNECEDVEEVSKVAATLTNKAKLAKFIQAKILGHSPQTVRSGSPGGAFERGTILIKGLTQQEACAIYEFLKPNGAAASYQRLSTHGDLIWGVDLDQSQYIPSKDGGKFRHLLFSMPQPYEGEIEHADNVPALEKINQYVTDSKYKDKPFYIRLKPESYGMNDVLSIIGHSASYLHTRIFSGYKEKPGYYGEGKKSKNGEFIIDAGNISKQNTIEPIFDKNANHLQNVKEN